MGYQEKGSYCQSATLQSVQFYRWIWQLSSEEQFDHEEIQQLVMQYLQIDNGRRKYFHMHTTFQWDSQNFVIYAWDTNLKTYLLFILDNSCSS